MKKGKLTWLILFILIGLEVYAAQLAYHTIGEVISSLYLVLIGLNAIPIVLLLSKTMKKWGVVLMSIIALAILPYQFYLGSLLNPLEIEAEKLVDYLEREKGENGTYPQDLSDYNFNQARLENHFRYQKLNNEFELSYFVGTPNTSHFYLNQTGQWFYYAD